MLDKPTPCDRAAKAMESVGITESQKSAMGVFVHLAKAWDVLTATLRGALSESCLSESQFGVLEALYSSGPLGQRQLSEIILKSSGNLTMVIDNLERRGLVQRERDKDDRRQITVHLTPDGDKLIRLALPQHAIAMEQGMRELTKAEQQQLITLCDKLRSDQNFGNQAESIKTHLTKEHQTHE